MEESKFVKLFETTARELLTGLSIQKGANLLYEITLDNNLELTNTDFKNPKRGSSAFQTDICIFDKKYPRVVIEFKTQISTHDVITYSYKAGQHKKIYPGLRYGMLASEIENIPDRFFIHNEHIDFFIAAKEYKEDKLKEMIKTLIKNEIKTSKKLEDIYFNRKKFNYYRTDINFGNIE
jgi:hypothetical protein